MIDPSVRELLHSKLGNTIEECSPLHGGCVSEVYQLHLSSGSSVVCKIPPALGSSLTLENEAFMLNYLREHTHLPVPEVLYVDETVLVLEFVDSDSQPSSNTQSDAADCLSRLHALDSKTFGFQATTILAGIELDNRPTGQWVEFFRTRRLEPVTQRALLDGRITARMTQRLLSLGERLNDFIKEPEKPALIHGDVWSGNILFRQGRGAAFLDPAIYFAHPEMELSFICLFNTFGKPFFDRYQSESGRLEADFFRVRSDIYNLIPLLVHAILFGESYVQSIDRILNRHGF